MTLQDYAREEHRIIQRLTGYDPEDKEYGTLLLNHENLYRAALQDIDIRERYQFAEETAGVPAPNEAADNVVEFPVEQPFPEPEPEETPKPKSEPAPTPVEEEPEKPIDFATVKAAFTEAARSGVKVSEIINDTGYTKLSDIPADLYGALMRALERKKAGEEA